MGFIAAKCTQCGAVLQVDESKDAAICSHCGMPFIVEKAINNYNTSIVNNIAAEQVLVSADGFSNELDKLRFHNQMEHWNEAKSLAIMMQKEFPNHVETWYESAYARTKGFKEFPATLDFETFFKYIGSLAGENSQEYQQLLLYWNQNEESLVKDKYERAVSRMETALDSYTFQFTAEMFESIMDYSDSAEKYEICIREAERARKKEMKIRRRVIIVLIAVLVLGIIAGVAGYFINHAVQKKETYDKISILRNNQEYEAAIQLCAQIPDYKDVDQIKAAILDEKRAFEEEQKREAAEADYKLILDSMDSLSQEIVKQLIT